MSAGYDDEGKGALFREREKKSEKSPDYTGRVQINGTKYRLAGWVRESKAGQRFLSLAIEEAQGGIGARLEQGGADVL
jgi:uncharacterized protein (DUF736 family)